MIKVYIEFIDKNMPNVNVDCKNISEATREGASLLQRYASVSNLVIEFEDGEKSFYNSKGIFLFSIPKMEPMD